MSKENSKVIIYILEEVTVEYASLLSFKIQVEKAKHSSARTKEANSKTHGKGLLAANLFQMNFETH